MPRKKSYIDASQASAISVVPHQDVVVQKLAQLSFDEVFRDTNRLISFRTVHFERWLGCGIDAWVWSALDVLTDALRSGASAPDTVRSRCDAIKVFFDFLLAGRAGAGVPSPEELKPLHITQFVEWLKVQAASKGWANDTVRVFYQRSKLVLSQMMVNGVIHGDPSRFFPRRSILPNDNAEQRGARAFSDGELQRLAHAIKQDLVDLHHGRLSLRDSDVIANRFLIVAMRTGANTTPLLELQRDALLPGLLPGTQRLRIVKYRGHVIHERALVRSNDVEQQTLIPLDAVAVLERALSDTEHLAAVAPPAYQNKVWLFQSSDVCAPGDIRCLRVSNLADATERLIKRHSLMGDDGKPLRVNVSRLRKSFAKRVFRLSGGDAVTTASLLGNTPKVADMNYLHVDDQLKAESAVFIGRELAVHLRGDGTAKIAPLETRAGADSRTEPTPIGRCQDTMNGDRAPKDGHNHCDLFVMCLFCPSFAVVGEPDDLWRLYSYRIFAQKELARLEQQSKEFGVDPAAERLVPLYQAAVPFIDSFCRQAFGATAASTAMHKASIQLHPFWDLQLRRVAATRGAR